MGLLTTGRTVLTNGNLDDLLTRFAKGHPIIKRMGAEAFIQYPPKSPMLDYLFDYFTFLEVLNEDATSFLEELSDSWDATSTKGKLGYLRKKQVWTLLGRELAEFEAQNQSLLLLGSKY